MITYEQVQLSMPHPPPKELVNLYNELGDKLIDHPSFVRSRHELYIKDSFCICATSIQSKYVAFVLGKYAYSDFPEEIVQLFFNIHSQYRVQFGNIDGSRVDGCICVIHSEGKTYNLQQVYEHIYS